ncbi:unnamed protein product [Protopolystoma xenopodis]|uniref:Uncharacterized protein n=1 Tax=Protopolystoma xenopodis TaxID=117903 RepID=A0A3S5CHF5_9PLAT|nr:unnamed protein product [Protopolystoma xenopodis]
MTLERPSSPLTSLASSVSPVTFTKDLSSIALPENSNQQYHDDGLSDLNSVAPALSDTTVSTAIIITNTTSDSILPGTTETVNVDLLPPYSNSETGSSSLIPILGGCVDEKSSSDQPQHTTSQPQELVADSSIPEHVSFI